MKENLTELGNLVFKIFQKNPKMIVLIISNFKIPTIQMKIVLLLLVDKNIKLNLMDVLIYWQTEENFVIMDHIWNIYIKIKIVEQLDLSKYKILYVVLKKNIMKKIPVNIKILYAKIWLIKVVIYFKQRVFQIKIVKIKSINIIWISQTFHVLQMKVKIVLKINKTIICIVKWNVFNNYQKSIKINILESHNINLKLSRQKHINK